MKRSERGCVIRFEPVCVAGVRETVHNDLRLTGVEGLAHPVAELVVGDGAPEPAMYTASLSHLRTMLPKSSSCPKPAQRPNHAT